MIAEYDCSHVVDVGDEPCHHLVLANEYVRAFAVEVPPQSRTLCHRHPHDYLLYVASGAEVISAARDEEPKRLSYADGECELSKAGLVHVVDNRSRHAFRNVVVELQPEAMKLRRGGAPLLTSGAGKIDHILGEKAGAVCVINLEAGAEAECAGPAVLAAPYEPVMVREIEEYDVALDGFRKLMWVCAPRSVGIRNPGNEPARVLAFQVGA